jgi:hypothetical protein
MSAAPDGVAQPPGLAARSRTPQSLVDPGWLIALALGLLAAWPLLTRAGLPTNTDADLHIFRTDQIMRAWGQGVWYPRWAPDLAFGFGYPVFNYYAPLAHHLGALSGSVVGDPVAGVKFVLVLSSALGALGVYGLAREFWGGRAGVISAWLFSLAPYVAYINPIARGAAPETLATALAPGVWWAFVRLRRHSSAPRLPPHPKAPLLRGQPGLRVIAAAGLATLTLSHNLLSFVFVGLMLAWLAWEALWTPASWMSADGRRAWLQVGTALALGLGLSAFMWLPALAERSAVQFQRAFARVQDPRTPLQFVDVAELLAPSGAADVAELPVSGWAFQAGAVQWIMATAGMLMVVWAGPSRPLILFLTLASLGLVVLVTPWAEPIWRAGAASPLVYLQLPWRLLGPLALTLALLGGAAIHGTQRWLSQWQAHLFGVLVLSASLIGVWPLLDPLPWAPYGPVTPQRLFLFEQSGNVGTTAQNEFLPASVQAMPAPRDTLVQSYSIGPVDKIDYASLPAGAQAVVVDHGPAHDTFQINTPTGFTLTILTFDFPGWTAYVDGAQVPIRPSTPHGFITVDLPGGEHRLALRFEDTLSRWIGWLLSGLALTVSVGLWAWKRPSAVPEIMEPTPWTFAAVVTALIACACVARWAVDRASPWQQPLPANAVVNATAKFDGNLILQTYDLPRRSAGPGETISLSLYWQASGPAPRDLSVFVHLVGPDGQVWGQSDKPRPVDEWPTDRWPVGRLFADTHQLVIRPEAPPGVYALRAGLWDRLSRSRLRVLAPTEADSANLTTTFIIRP